MKRSARLRPRREHRGNDTCRSESGFHVHRQALRADSGARPHGLAAQPHRCRVVHGAVLCFAICLTVCEAAMGAVSTSKCSGDISHQTASYIDSSLRAFVSELPADELVECVFETHGEKNPGGISLRVKLVCEDEGTFEETRIVTSASGAAQARTMARSLLKEREDFWKNRPTTVEIHSLGLVAENVGYKARAWRGMIAGYVIAISGLTSFFIAPMVATFSDSDIDLKIINVSGGIVILGNIVIFSAYATRHRAYHDAERRVRAYPAILTGLFNALHAGLYVDSLIEFSKPIDPDDWFQISFKGIALACSAWLVEIINLAACTNLWRREFRQTDTGTNLRVSVAPLIFRNRVGDTRSVAPGLGVVGMF